VQRRTARIHALLSAALHARRADRRPQPMPDRRDRRRSPEKPRAQRDVTGVTVRPREIIRGAHPGDHEGEVMTVQDILRTHPRPLIANVAALARCRDECARVRGDVHDLRGRVRGRGRRQGPGPLHPALPRLCGRLRRRRAHPRPPDRCPSPTQLNALEACLAACPRVRRRLRAPRHHHEHCRVCAEECRRCEQACEKRRSALATP
jgi:hypothetical protein